MIFNQQHKKVNFPQVIVVSILNVILLNNSLAENNKLQDVSVNSLYCGPDCVYVLAKLKDKDIQYGTILSDMTLTDKGVSMADIKHSLKKHLDLETEGYNLSYNQLLHRFNDFAIARLIPPDNKGYQVIAHWVLLTSINKDSVFCISPPSAKLRFSRSEFIEYWTGDVLTKPIHDTFFLNKWFISGGLLFFVCIMLYMVNKMRRRNP